MLPPWHGDFRTGGDVARGASRRSFALNGRGRHRIRFPGAPVLSNETACLNETRSVRCVDCSFCDGERAGASNVVITVHGPRAARFGKAA